MLCVFVPLVWMGGAVFLGSDTTFLVLLSSLHKNNDHALRCSHLVQVFFRSPRNPTETAEYAEKDNSSHPFQPSNPNPFLP